MRALALLMGILAILLVGCSVDASQPVSSKPMQQFVIDETGTEVMDVSKPTPAPLVFEVEHDISDQEWIAASADRRRALNEVYIKNEDARQAKIRQDTVKSKNWHTHVEGRTVSGYDVIRDQRGEFDDYPQAAKSERYLYHISEFE